MTYDTKGRTFSRDGLTADFQRRFAALNGAPATDELATKYVGEFAANLLREGWTEQPNGESPQASCGGPNATQPDDSKTDGETPAASTPRTCFLCDGVFDPNAQMQHIGGNTWRHFPACPSSATCEVITGYDFGFPVFCRRPTTHSYPADGGGALALCAGHSELHPEATPINAPSLSSGTPAGSEADVIASVTNLVNDEDWMTANRERAMVPRRDLRVVLTALRSAQERVTDLEHENAEVIRQYDTLNDALAVSQARERQAAKDDERFRVIARDALSLHCNFIGGDENWTVTYHDVVNAGEDSHFHAHSPRAAVDRYLESATAMYKKVPPGARSVDGGTPA